MSNNKNQQNGKLGPEFGLDATDMDSALLDSLRMMAADVPQDVVVLEGIWYTSPGGELAGYELMLNGGTLALERNADGTVAGTWDPLTDDELDEVTVTEGPENSLVLRWTNGATREVTKLEIGDADDTLELGVRSQGMESYAAVHLGTGTVVAINIFDDNYWVEGELTDEETGVYEVTRYTEQPNGEMDVKQLSDVVTQDEGVFGDIEDAMTVLQDAGPAMLLRMLKSGTGSRELYEAASGVIRVFAEQVG